MMRPSTEVRSATPDEMPRAIAAIVAAFLPGVHANGDALEGCSGTRQSPSTWTTY